MTEKTSYHPGEPNWVDVVSPDLDASIAFYGALFGWTAEKGDQAQYGGYTTFFKNGKRVAGLGPQMSPEQPVFWTTYVATEDADKAAGLVRESNGTVLLDPMTVGPMGRMAIFADPTGAAFGVWQPGQHTGAELVGEEGTFTWTELSTRDQAAALPFYSKVFGWEPRVSEGYTEFRLGGRSVAGCMDMPPAVPADVPSYWMPYFAASEPAAKAQEAAGLGATVVVASMDFTGGTFSLVQDPHGALFGLLDLSS
jgi:predicted enzyme related to lactoylglutathione lyase